MFSGMILRCWFNELPVFQRTTVLSFSRAKEPKKKILIMHFSPFSPYFSLWCQNILYSRLLSHTLNLYETWGFCSGDYEKYCLLECGTIKRGRSVLVFEKIWLSLHCHMPWWGNSRSFGNVSILLVITRHNKNSFWQITANTTFRTPEFYVYWYNWLP